jgi:hypothetical protein
VASLEKSRPERLEMWEGSVSAHAKVESRQAVFFFLPIVTTHVNSYRSVRRWLHCNLNWTYGGIGQESASLKRA